MTKYCIEPGCKSDKTANPKSAGYSFKGDTPKYCVSHKKDGMVNTKGANYCREVGCVSKTSTGKPSTASYGMPGKGAQYCKVHAKPGMANVKTARCAPHGTILLQCKLCGGTSYCDHGNRKSQCKICNLSGYVFHVIANRIYSVLNPADKLIPTELNDTDVIPNTTRMMTTVEILGCSIAEFMTHIEKTWTFGMNWSNHGDTDDSWHIDHIEPINFGTSVSGKVKLERLHYKNTQALWKADNLSKSNNYIGK